MYRIVFATFMQKVRQSSILFTLNAISSPTNLDDVLEIFQTAPLFIMLNDTQPNAADSKQLLQSSATPNDIFTFYSVFMAGKRKCPEQSSCISFFSFFILYFPFSSPSSPFYGWKCQGRRSNCRRLHSLTTKWDNGCRRSNKT